MKSKYILILHTTLFTTFVIGSIMASIAMVFFPEFLSGRYLFYFLMVLAVLIIGSWPLFGGCLFTKWENHYRELESLGLTYRGSCVIRYAKKWFNINLPGRLDVYILIILFILPAVTALFNW